MEILFIDLKHERLWICFQPENVPARPGRVMQGLLVVHEDSD
jgi:hypothetical protein